MPITHPTPHLEKLNAALNNEKLPENERHSLEKALEAYEQWIALMTAIKPVNEGQKIEQVVYKFVEALNKYKLYIDLQVIFDSPGDFLYRQKGQLKLDNTIIEEFLPHLIYKTIPELREGYEIGPKSCFSAIYFESSVGRILSGGGPQIRKKIKILLLAASYSSRHLMNEILKSRLSRIPISVTLSPNAKQI